MQNRWLGIIFGVLVLLALGAIVNANVDFSGWKKAGDSLSAAAASSEPAASAPAARNLPDFTGLVQKYGAAVVNISVVGNAVNAGPSTDQSDPLFEFFRQFGIPAPRGRIPPQGLGSGFIISADGTIMTNAHVVSNASRVTVKLTDKREFEAKVIGVDTPSDVAVIKISADSLPVVNMDTADDVRPGEWVVAIGSPYGFDNSVTSGIVSATARTLPGASYVPFIQTDVAVNPGNSGGPLFNMRGEVVGINSQIYTRSGGYQGLSFAIPIGIALHVKDELVRHGHVTRGKLGVVIQDVNQALADSFNLERPRGALVSSVEAGGPAAKAGIQSGDVIVQFNDTPIASSSELPVLVAQTSPGTKASVQVVRGGNKRTFNVVVAELAPAAAATTARSGGNGGKLGVVARALTPEEQRQANTDGGVIVTDVSGSAAAAGIEPGDLILSVNNTRIKSPEQLRSSVNRAGKHVALLVQRGDARLYVPVDLS